MDETTVDAHRDCARVVDDSADNLDA